MAVQTRETRCREGLVDRSPVFDPWISLGDGSRERRQLLREGRVREARRSRSGAVVDEPDDRPDPQLAQAREAAVWPGPVRFRQAVRARAFPEDRKTQRGDAELGEAVEVVEPSGEPGQLDLVGVAIPDPVDRALGAAPQLESRD